MVPVDLDEITALDPSGGPDVLATAMLATCGSAPPTEASVMWLAEAHRPSSLTVATPQQAEDQVSSG